MLVVRFLLVCVFVAVFLYLCYISMSLRDPCRLGAVLRLWPSTMVLERAVGRASGDEVDG